MATNVGGLLVAAGLVVGGAYLIQKSGGIHGIQADLTKAVGGG